MTVSAREFLRHFLTRDLNGGLLAYGNSACLPTL
jgi:hypothetical protein